VYAVAKDGQGLYSTRAQAQLSVTPPDITSFFATLQNGTTWLFQGHVSDYSATGLNVIFGGLTSVQGQTATIDSNGNFYLTVQLQPGEQGSVTAQTGDWYGQLSNLAQTNVTL
jgi:hypothetical protein